MVGIGSFGFSLVCFPVFEGLVLPSTTATVVAIASSLCSAVDKLLLGEGDEVASFDEVGSLECSSGRECPA